MSHPTPKKTGTTGSTKKLNIYQRLAKIMQDVGTISKSQSKDDGIPYKFVTHDSVTSAVRPHLIKYGVVVAPTVYKHSRDGNFTHVEMMVDFVNIDDPEDVLSVRSDGYGIDKQDKGIGKAVSYAVKTAVLKVLFLETGEAEDNENYDIDREPGEKATGKSKNKTNGKTNQVSAVSDIDEKLKKAKDKKDLENIYNDLKTYYEDNKITNELAVKYKNIISKRVSELDKKPPKSQPAKSQPAKKSIITELDTKLNSAKTKEDFKEIRSIIDEYHLSGELDGEEYTQYSKTIQSVLKTLELTDGEVVHDK
jgi:hypothetical protein